MHAMFPVRCPAGLSAWHALRPGTPWSCSSRLLRDEVNSLDSAPGLTMARSCNQAVSSARRSAAWCQTESTATYLHLAGKQQLRPDQAEHVGGPVCLRLAWSCSQMPPPPPELPLSSTQASHTLTRSCLGTSEAGTLSPAGSGLSPDDPRGFGHRPPPACRPPHQRNVLPWLASHSRRPHFRNGGDPCGEAEQVEESPARLQFPVSAHPQSRLPCGKPTAGPAWAGLRQGQVEPLPPGVQSSGGMPRCLSRPVAFSRQPRLARPRPQEGLTTRSFLPPQEPAGLP